MQRVINPYIYYVVERMLRYISIKLNFRHIYTLYIIFLILGTPLLKAYNLLMIKIYLFFPLLHKQNNNKILS